MGKSKTEKNEGVNPREEMIVAIIMMYLAKRIGNKLDGKKSGGVIVASVKERCIRTQ